MLVAADSPAGIADQFEAAIIWMSEEEMLPGRPYLLKIGAKTVGASIAPPKYKVNVNTLEHLAAKTLHLNEIGDVQPQSRPADRLRSLRRRTATRAASS